MNKIILILGLGLLSFIGSNKSTNNNTSTITGTVTEIGIDEKLAGATITLWQNEKEIATTIVGENGKFYLENIPNGIYDLKIENFSYESYCQKLVIDSPEHVHLGELRLKLEENELEEIIIDLKN